MTWVMSGLPRHLEALLRQDREHKAALCRELGLDPARVVSIERHPERPDDVARVVMLDGFVEDHLIPAGWRL